MTAFTASNGIEITPMEDRVALCITLAIGGTIDQLFPAREVTALREYFQHERDQELGRWRDPENPDIVVYPKSDGSRVWVLHEPTGVHAGCSRTDKGYLESSYDLFQSARRYFDAHPEPEPKPWENAKPGEVWALTIDGREEAVAVFSGARNDADCRYIPGATHIESTNPAITAGRRIWPEQEDGECCEHPKCHGGSLCCCQKGGAE